MAEKKKKSNLGKEIKKTGGALKQSWGGLWKLGDQIKNIDAAKKRGLKTKGKK